MSTITMKKAATKTATNLSRLHKALASMDTVIKVDYYSIYFGMWDKDENGDECLRLDMSDSTEQLTFSKDAIDGGTIDENSITMKDEDGREHVLAFFSTKAVSL